MNINNILYYSIQRNQKNTVFFQELSFILEEINLNSFEWNYKIEKKKFTWEPIEYLHLNNQIEILLCLTKQNFKLQTYYYSN